MLGFDYELYVVEDHQYGQELSNGTWDGLIGQLAEQVCLSIASSLHAAHSSPSRK